MCTVAASHSDFLSPAKLWELNFRKSLELELLVHEDIYNKKCSTTLHYTGLSSNMVGLRN